MIEKDGVVTIYERKSKNVTNVVFSLNRACNLRCTHCCLNNEYKKDKSVITVEMLEQYFTLIDSWVQDQKHVLSFVSIVMSGAEIGMLDDEVFESYGDKIFAFYQSLSAKYQTEDLLFDMVTLSNFTNLTERKKEWLVKTSKISKARALNFTVATSYEKHTNRFSKPVFYDIWKDNLDYFMTRDVETAIIWTVGRQDAEDYESILKNFEEIGSHFIYVPLIPTGESTFNKELFTDYEAFSEFLLNLYSYPFKKDLLVGQPYICHYDKICNLILEQNGFIMIDLLQDQVFNYEQNKEFEFKVEYLKENTNIVKLSDDLEANKLLLNNLWLKYLKKETDYLREQGCFTCDYYKSCRGGIGTFKPIFHSKDKCSGFKGALDTFFKDKIPF